MRNSLSFRALAIVGFASLAAAAADFNPLMNVVRATWPERQHIGVICNYPLVQEQINQLASAAGPDARITVVDTRIPRMGPHAAQMLANRNADFLMLVPGDPHFGDGRFDATNLVRHLALRGIPSVGTSPEAVKQGAVFAVGDGTKGELLVTDKVRGTISVILPDKVFSTRGMGSGRAHAGSAKVEVVTLP